MSARPLELVIPAGRFSWKTSTSGTPVSTTANASSMRLAKNTPPPIVATAPSTSAVATAPLEPWLTPASERMNQRGQVHGIERRRQAEREAVEHLRRLCGSEQGLVVRSLLHRRGDIEQGSNVVGIGDDGRVDPRRHRREIVVGAEGHLRAGVDADA